MFKALKEKASDILEQGKQGLLSEDQSVYFGPLWESNEHTWQCNACQAPFQPPIVTKHHCRYCGLIYCNSCAPVLPSNTNVITMSAAKFVASQNENGQHKINAPPGAIILDASIRVCSFCMDGRSPGSTLRYKAKDQMADVHVKHKLLAPKSAHSKRMKNKDDKDSLHVVANAIGLGEHHDGHSKVISLSRRR